MTFSKFLKFISLYLFIFLSLPLFSLTKAYVLCVGNEVPSKISIIDVSTDNIIKTFETWEHPSFAMASSDQEKMYVGHVVHHLIEFSVRSDFPWGDFGIGAIKGVRGKGIPEKLYFTSFDEENFIASIAVVDTKADKLVKKISWDGFPQDVAITPKGDRIFISCIGPYELHAITTKNDEHIGKISFGLRPGEIGITPDGSKVYMLTDGDFPVSVIDAENFQLKDTMHFEYVPTSVVFSENSPIAYLAFPLGSHIAVVNTETDTVLEKIDIQGQPFSLAMTKNGEELYVTDFFGERVTVINTKTHGIIATIPMEKWLLGGGAEIFFTPDHSKAYLTNNSNITKLTVINTSTYSVDKEIHLDAIPRFISFVTVREE